MSKFESFANFEKAMLDPEFKASYEAGYENFSLAEDIREILIDRGVTVEELALATGYSERFIQGIRSGSRDKVKTETLRKILKSAQDLDSKKHPRPIRLAG